MSEVPRIARVRTYGVAPDSIALQRYVGTDVPFRLSLELLRVTLSTGAEGVASCCSGWRGAPVGLLTRRICWFTGDMGKLHEGLDFF